MRSITHHRNAELTGWRTPRRNCVESCLSWGFVVLAQLACFFIMSGETFGFYVVREPGNEAQGGDYSDFKHDNPNHSRLPCLLCHRRESNEARPTMPGNAKHVPCIGCHAKQFADSSGPICIICHTDPNSGSLKEFPRLSSFGMRFDHATHVSVRGAGCATCHRPARGGVALSIPSGFGAHTTCYSCHSSRAQANGRDISSCGTCHQPGGKRSRSMQAAAFRIGFSHAKHDRTESLSCNACHRVGGGNRNVSSPQPLNHHASPRAFSCMSCHNGTRSFGGDDFSVCKRCHTGNAWRF
jgi:predicted CXXCH cytochrome family protein